MKQKFTELFKKHGYYFLAGACVIALASAIGIISATTPDNNAVQNAAGFTDAQTEEIMEETMENPEGVAASSGLDYTEGYNADEIQDIITQIEEAQAENTNTEIAANEEENVSDTDDAISTAAEAAAIAEINAFDESQTLNWPLSGSILLDYSMNTTTYFKTLNQYKVNPGLLIAADINSEVHCAYSGTVESITGDAELGQVVTINIGNDFRTIYGQLKDISVAEGEVVAAGNLIGHVAAPTKYYIDEGSHLYFGLTKDEIPTDPKLFLQ